MKSAKMIISFLALTTLTMECFPFVVSTGVDVSAMQKRVKDKLFDSPNTNSTKVSWSKKNYPTFGMLLNVNLPFGIGPYCGVGLRVDFANSHSSPNFSKLITPELQKDFFVSSVNLNGTYTSEQIQELASFISDNVRLKYKRVMSAFFRCGCQFLSFYVELGAGLSHLKTKVTRTKIDDTAAILSGNKQLADAYETFATRDILHFKKTGIAYNVEIGYKIGTFYSIAVSGGYLPIIKAYRVGLGVRVGL